MSLGFRLGVLISLLLFPVSVNGVLAASGTANVCSKAAAGMASCHAQYLSDSDGAVRAHALPAGYGPVQLHAAYGAPVGGRSVIAIVAAFNTSAVKADLDHYNQTFGLPVFPSCSSVAQPACFERVNQRGGTNFGGVNAGWALETAMDVETVHQMCSGCRIELVEADSAGLTNLMASVDRAVALGARVVSMSWGGGETATIASMDAHFTNASVIFVASSGDSGYGVSYPASSSHVIAVGGTRLVMAGGRTETAWSGSGSGCSKYIVKPLWQHDVACARRSVADISAVADPQTGAAIYSSQSGHGAGWFVVGGTSLAAPLVAGMLGLAGGGNQAALMNSLYHAPAIGRIRDITAGVNGTCASYLCRAGAGYDGPSGLGSLIGLGAL